MIAVVPHEIDLLIHQCRPQLVRYLGRLVGEADAEDVVQIALAKAADALPSFRGEASPRSWLFRIATNAGHDFNRAHRPHLPEPLPADDEATPDDLSVDATQERHLVREQMSQCVLEVLGRLPETYRTALALSDCEELSDRDLAAVLGVTVGAAKIRLHRARARLKDELERECTFYRDDSNVLCCDRKGDVPAKPGTEARQNSLAPAYPSTPGIRHQDGGHENGRHENLNQESPMANETLPTKQKHLIGVGAAIAAGCQPCTSSFVAAAREAGACERGVRLMIDTGLELRQAAAGAMSEFAERSFAHPRIDDAFRAERALQIALTGVAAALVANAATLLESRIQAARSAGATDGQIRMAAQIGLTARRGAQDAAEAALAETLGERVVLASGAGCGCASTVEPAQRANDGASSAGCGCAPG